MQFSFKTRLTGVQLGVLNNVVGSRSSFHSVLYNLKFLEGCLENSVAPRRIQRRVKKSKVYHSAVIERAFVKDELTKTRAILHKKRDAFLGFYRQAKGFLGFFDYIRLSWLLSECDRRQRTSLESKNNGSLARLRQERYGCQTNDYGTIFNLTNIELTTLQKEVLCRGVDFGIPPKISEPDVLAEFELLLREASRLRPVSQEAAVRSKCELEAVAREIAASKPDMREFSLDREHRKVLRELRMDKRLVITKPDKGRAMHGHPDQGYVRRENGEHLERQK